MHHLQDKTPTYFEGENSDIMFTKQDAKLVHHPHIGALVVKVRIETNNIYIVLVENGSAFNVLTYKVLLEDTSP